VLNDGTTFGNDVTPYFLKDAQTAGLTISKTVTYSPTAVDLTAPLQELKSAGAQVVVPLSYSGITALVAGMHQLGWPTKTVSTGSYLVFFLQPSQLPPGTVDGCDVGLPASDAPSSLAGLTDPPKTILEQVYAAEKGKASTFGAWQIYTELLMTKAAVEKAGSLDSNKLIAATESLTNVQAGWPGVTETFTPTDHTGWQQPIDMCQLTLGPFQATYLAP
jgi:ABC-type branched-subunit amino acid transport system substrate-binding protein